MQAKAARTPSDRRSSRDRSAQPPMLDLIDAARSRRNGQPKAWQEWPCDAVAALPPVGEARRRADAGTPAPKGEISGLHPRAVFPREAALTRRLEGRYAARSRRTGGPCLAQNLPRPILAKSVSESTEFGKCARLGAPAGTVRDTSTTSGLSKPAAGAGGSSSRKQRDSERLWSSGSTG